MKQCVTLSFACLLFVISLPGCQSQTRVAAAAAATKNQTEPAPATKMEAFKPVEGSVITLGVDDISSGIAKVHLEARQFKASDGSGVKGMRVQVTESQYREEVVFIDADELPELIRAITALQAVSSNPTHFRDFEVQYKTRGSLKLTVFNDRNGSLEYAIEAGRFSKASVFTDAAGLASLKDAFTKAQQKLDSVTK